MHGHIKDTVLDFGSLYSFWLFSFERYNGMLSQTETNRRPGLEQTIACSFLESVHAPDFVRQIAPQFENDVQADILSQMISNPPTMTTATWLEADTFDIGEFIRTSEEIVHATGSEPLPAQPQTLRKQAIRMARAH